MPRLLLSRDASRGIIKNIAKGNLIIPLPINDSCYAGLRNAADFNTFREVCLQDCYNFSQIKEGMIIIDVGAHIGSFALLASKKAGKTGKVIAIEPEIRNFEQLKKNLTLNNIENVTPLNIALSNFNGEKELFIAKNPGCNSFFPNMGYEITGKAKVKAESLNALFSKMDLQRIDFLKMDCEGAEYEILFSAAPEHLKQIKHIAMEYHNSAEPMIDFLKKLNFSVQHKVISRAQGMIYAKR